MSEILEIKGEESDSFSQKLMLGLSIIKDSGEENSLSKIYKNIWAKNSNFRPTEVNQISCDENIYHNMDGIKSNWEKEGFKCNISKSKEKNCKNEYIKIVFDSGMTMHDYGNKIRFLYQNLSVNSKEKASEINKILHMLSKRGWKTINIPERANPFFKRRIIKIAKDYNEAVSKDKKNTPHKDVMLRIVKGKNAKTA